MEIVEYRHLQEMREEMRKKEEKEAEREAAAAGGIEALHAEQAKIKAELAKGPPVIGKKLE